jgi:hypothetical protein
MNLLSYRLLEYNPFIAIGSRVWTYIRIRKLELGNPFIEVPKPSVRTLLYSKPLMIYSSGRSIWPRPMKDFTALPEGAYQV